MEGWVVDIVIGVVTILVSLYIARRSTMEALQAWKTKSEVEDATQNGAIETLRAGLKENKNEIQSLRDNFQQHQLSLPRIMEERMEKWSEGFFSKIENLLVKNNENIKVEFDMKLAKKSDKRGSKK